MRPPTKKLPLSLETVFQTMVPGREYTVTVIRRLYEGTNDQIDAVLQAGIVNGMLDRSGENVRGFKQRYWRREEFEKPICGVAERRTGPNEVATTLSGYDLLKNARLCNNFRRS